MPKKLAIAAICAVLLLCGCGASAADECAPMEVCENDAAAEISVFQAPAGGDGSGSTDETGALAFYGTADPGSAAPESAGVTDASDVSYFTFSRREQNTTDETGQMLLYERFCEPAFYSADSDLSRWINEILAILNGEFRTNSENLLEYAEEFLELNGSEYFYSYSNYQELGIARHDESIVSLVAVSSLYSGGAHPNAVQTAFNLDIENRKLLRLEDVIAEEDAQDLTQMVIDGVREKFEDLSDYALYDDYQQTIELSLTYGTMTPYWYFNEKGLVVFFNQYELGPYAAGIIKVELPYEALTDIMAAEYVPEYLGSGGDLKLSDAVYGTRIPITIETDGERLTIGVEGRVFQIQLSEVYWLEQTPIMQEILFSAASMGSGDLLEVIGGYTDDGRSFAIEFIDAEGQQRIYYLNTEGLSEEP